MDYKDLANLIFPNAKEISYYEEKYPRRGLPEGAMVLRVAPSPTGNVHIGTIYQALINKIAAKRSGGIFRHQAFHRIGHFTAYGSRRLCSASGQRAGSPLQSRPADRKSPKCPRPNQSAHPADGGKTGGRHGAPMVGKTPRKSR